MKLTWFGHSAFRIEYQGVVVMLDPFLDNPTWDGDNAAAWDGADYVALTHGHADHIGSTVEIASGTGATVIANPEICKYLAELGVTATEAINHGGELTFDGFSVAYVPAWHSSSNDSEDGDGRYLGNPGGFIFNAPGQKTLYAMGDTGIFGDMQLIADIYTPAIGLVPIGDRFTMGGRLAAMACRRFFKFETVIPCHYATFGLLDPDERTFEAGLEGSGTRILVPERGVTVSL